MGAPEERPLAVPMDIVTVNGPCADRGKRKTTFRPLPDHEWAGVTRFQAALALSAVQLLVTTGLVAYVIVLKRSQCFEWKMQTDVVQSSVAENGKCVEVLPPCGNDGIWYQNKCYYFSETQESWTEAKDSCAALNFSLALIDNQKELDFMMRHKGKHDHWIGLQRDIDQPWKWVDGTEFSNWFVVEDYSECAYLNHDRVKSAECYGKRNSICTKVSAYE